MVVEKFSNSLIKSGLLKLYVATGFFSVIIFFIINIDFFTLDEIFVGLVLVTIVFKSLSNIIYSLIMKFYSLEPKRKEINFKFNEERINTLMEELKFKEYSKDIDMNIKK